MQRFIFLCTCFAALFIGQAAYAATTVPVSEEIATFNSTITVKNDASIKVTEKIKVYATGDKIKRGLIRTLPKQYRDSYGINRHNSYVVKKVFVNGSNSPYHIKQDRRKFAIYVGDKDHFLKPGWYEYTFEYVVKHAVNFLKDADELYWNVTGSDWEFPILQASSTVTLPPGTKVTYFRGYTGKKGAKGLNYTPTQLAPDMIHFQTTAPLPPGSGFTIALAWPKGIIQQPHFMSRMNNRLDLNAGSYIVIEIAVITLLYFLLAWQMYGQDPEKGPIFPRFAPPENISPALARYLIRMGFDMKTVTASIISLATRGFIKIDNNDSTFTLTKISSSPNKPTEEEATLLAKLFESKDSVELKRENRSVFNSLKTKLKQLLQDQNQGRYFVTNSKLLIPGIILLIFAGVSAATSANDRFQAAFSIIWLSGWTAGTYILLYQTWIAIKQAFHAPSIKLIGAAVFIALFSIPFVIGECIGIFMLSQAIPIFTIPFLFLIAAMNAIFYILMKQPTEEGRKLMDEIEGFRMYLSTTESYRLKSYEPPEMTEELYEKYLAYAIAFDVENSWGEQLNSKLTTAGQAPDSYQPRWYSGPSWSTRSPAAFGTLVGAGMSSALSSTSVSSSASGGGGYSGGGGGGGGGGGW